MAGAGSGIPRLTLITIVLAVGITAGFHWLYPDVAVNAGLQLEFVIVALLCALAVEALVRLVARMRATRGPAADQPLADRPKKTP